MACLYCTSASRALWAFPPARSIASANPCIDEVATPAFVACWLSEIMELTLFLIALSIPRAPMNTPSKDSAWAFAPDNASAILPPSLCIVFAVRDAAASVFFRLSCVSA